MQNDDNDQAVGITVCPDCGEDLEWHTCGEKPSNRTLRIRELNDQLRKSKHHIAVRIAWRELVITRGVASYGDHFINRAVDAVRDFGDFTQDNDPYAEHDFGIFSIDGITLNWKIDYYDLDMENGSQDPSDPKKTRRLLTILLAEEY